MIPVNSGIPGMPDSPGKSVMAGMPGIPVIPGAGPALILGWTKEKGIEKCRDAYTCHVVFELYMYAYIHDIHA